MPAVKAKVIYFLVLFALLIVAIIFLDRYRAQQSTRDKSAQPSAAISGLPAENYSGPDLGLPIRLADINSRQGQVNPLGLVRSSKDQARFGHSGIDLPLKEGAPILAVATGPIVRVTSAGDPWGGHSISQLLVPTTSANKDKTGWVFIYEHVSPRAGLKVGDTVDRGETIAAKTAPNDFTAHFQLSHAFNDLTFTNDNTCWVDFLTPNTQQQLLSWWRQYRTTDHLINSWRTNQEEGKFPFRALLDKNAFPAGLELCYLPGTDVR